MKNISNKKRQRVSTIVAFAIVPMSGFATDIYIPSMPSMGSELKITSLLALFADIGYSAAYKVLMRRSTEYYKEDDVSLLSVGKANQNLNFLNLNLLIIFGRLRKIYLATCPIWFLGRK